MYIVANSDGHIISSTNGTNWSEPFNTGISIGKVAIGTSKIVYTRCDVEKEMNVQPGLYYTSVWNQTPVLAEGTDRYYYNEVHYLGNKFVAVGYENTSPKVPAYAYSEDGVNWIIGQIDPGYVATIGGGNDMQFNDVGYNGIGYFIISKVNGPGLAGGFYTTDLSNTLDEDNFVNPENFPVDANQLVYANYPEGGENFGTWSAFSDDRKSWFSTFNIDPSQTWNFIPGWDLTEALQFHTGLTSFVIAEATIGVLDGYVVWMLSTNNGQIMWWPHVPAGPFVSVPSPLMATVSSVSSLDPLEVTLSVYQPINNEKIKIQNATGLLDLNGTYFVESVGGNTYRLHTAVELNSPIDASEWVGTYNNSSATAALSRGTFIDALGYGNGKFFAGNDNEEVFACNQLVSDDFNNPQLVWTKVDDQNNSFTYWNDVDYGPMNSCGEVNYKLSLTPQNPETIQNYKYTGEGNMDTSVVTDEHGNKVSIQRTGYLEVVDECGNRKVISVKDGENFTNTPDSPYLGT